MTTSRSSLLARSALAAAFALLASGCPLTLSLEREPMSGEESGADEAPPAMTTEGCDPGAIESQNGGACATCASDLTGETVRICGDADTAACINQENAYGERCQRCATEDGEVLYDDCLVSADDVGAARCETVPADPSQPNAGDCTVCFDADGNFVSETCGSAPERADLDPSFCEAYENDAGRCVDCYDEAGALLSHQCALNEGEQPISCVETVDPSGLSCVQCFDSFGTLVQSDCNVRPPEARNCQLLSYSTQTCVVCTDDAGQPILTDCTSTGCDDPNSPDCAPADECWFEYDETQTLCRTCVVDAAAGATETQCLTNTNLVCTGVPADALPPDPNQGGEGAPPSEPGAECLVCSDVQSGVEVYRNCGSGSGTQQPPVCVDEVDDVGNVCTWCYDAYTGEALYSSCDGGDTCYVTGERALTDVDGAALGDNGQQAIATCYACADGANQDVTAGSFVGLCALPQDCVGPDGFVEPGVECPTVRSLVLAPLRCENAWSAYQAEPGTEQELLAVLGWALSERSVSLAAAAALGQMVDVGQCANECGCPRGDLLEVSFEDVQTATVREMFAGVTVPCDADDACPAGTMCIDGLCGL